MRLSGLIVIWFLVTSMAGCGEPAAPRVFVGGEVLLDGQPLPEGILSFYEPTLGWGNEIPIHDGEFTLTSAEGVLQPANYQVAILPLYLETTDENGEPARIQSKAVRIPDYLLNHKTSGLTAEIQAGENNLRFKATTRKPAR